MLVNYEGVPIPKRQIRVFRRVLQENWKETLTKRPREWTKTLIRVTEGRRSIHDPETGKRTFFYSWCGDWVTYHLERAGCLHRCLNRESINGRWRTGHNLTLLRVWAGDPVATRYAPKYIRRMFEKDESAGDSWHAWDADADACEDGYRPERGDLVLSPRKNGDHIEFWVRRRDQIITVSAGAQAGGTAAVRTRDLDLSPLVGIIDVSRLAPSTPY